MGMSDTRWKTITESQFPWEREALTFVRERLPDHEPYRAWANFEFIAEDGSINEVDLLVLTPKGFSLVEIKSRPGVLEGDAGTWIWHQDGKPYTYDNPLLLTDRKAKKLIGLLRRQKALKKTWTPFLAPRVFLSAPDLVCKLPDYLRDSVHLRDRESSPTENARPGIVAALTRWTPGAPDDPGNRRVDRPTAKAISRAMEEAGIRPSQRARRVGDYVLGELIAEGPAYQDWSAEHAAVKGVSARVRLYPVGLGLGAAARETNRRAAEREFRILQGVNHSGILRAEGFTIHERGAALIFEHDPKALRLDHFLREHGDALSIDARLGIIRQIAEVLRFAHEKKLVHRALSPQSVLVTEVDSPLPRVRVFNWQAGLREGGTSSSSGVSGTVNPEQLVEDASVVYMAPEVVSGNQTAGEYADVFSLGAIAFYLFSGQPPATSLLRRDEQLRAGRGLDLSAAMDGAGKAMRELVQYATCPDVANRLETVDDFLAYLQAVEEELTAPDEEEVEDPTEAKVNDRLPGGFVVKKRLGRGSCAVAFLVDRDGAESVLKIAATSEHNERIRAEAEVLKKLRHQHIVEFRDLLEIGDRLGLLMARAGEMTLAQRLRAEGRLHVDLLQRFGEDLLETIDWLEQQGIAHRDIKPDNIGVDMVGRKDHLHLVLFDFSLSRTSTENIRAGTRPYLDPFICLRRPPRWDLYAERFAAAMTLYEMATGTLPRWGDGQSDPAMVEEEVSLDTELLEADLREPMTEFFHRALRRDYAERFDTCQEMLRAWRRIFEAGERRAERDESTAASDLDRALEGIRPHTQLALLPLSTRVLTALDRLNLVTVEDLLRVPKMRIHTMRGVGNKTRRQIRDLVAELARRLPEIELLPETTAAPETEEHVPEHASVDLLLNRLLPAKGRAAESETPTIRLLLGLDELPGPCPPQWPSQTDVATARAITRARVSQIVSRVRQRWAKNPALTGLRDEMERFLDAAGGVMTARELSQAVLAARGSSRLEPGRSQAALAVARAAIEAEHERAEPRFLVRRCGDVILVALRLEMADYAERLGNAADQLAATDPLPGPARVREILEGVRPPLGVTLETSRLVQLAAAASTSAAVSNRLEIYPRGMPATRALKLAHGALLGAPELAAEEIRERVSSRYPEAEMLPGRPALDGLVRDAGWTLEWSAEARQGRGAYVLPIWPGLTTTTSGSSSLGRYPTGPGVPEVTPEVADARRFDERLRHAIDHGAFLALTVRPRDLRLAERVLTEHFPVDRHSLEALLLREMRAAAQAMKVDWGLVLAADAAPRDSKDWSNLMRLASRSLPKVEESLATADRTLLLTYPGLLARYDAVDFLERLRARVDQRNGLPGVWLLIPSDDQQAMPVIDGKAVPVITPGQWARIPDAWLQNLHRRAA
jgi:serine/threonine protein kinase